MKQKSLAELSFLLYQTKHRIILWFSLALVLVILIISSLIFRILNFSTFFPAFLLMALYVALLVIDIMKYRKYQFEFKGRSNNSKSNINKLETFLSGNVKTKTIQGHDFCVTDQFNNHLIFFLMKNGLLNPAL